MNGGDNIKQILMQHPECEEFLYPFLHKISDHTRVDSLADRLHVSKNVLSFGLNRTIKRAEQNPCNYQQMREQLIKPGHVNIAGFVNFLWQHEFIAEMRSKAEELGVHLNLSIFPKHAKKQFQNYLARCVSSQDLPDILIGKGFSSFMSQRFVDKFVKTGAFVHAPVSSCMGDVFRDAGLCDPDHAYHPFGVEEMVMIYDKTVPLAAELPTSWLSLLEPEYENAIMQMGKNRRDHFGFNIMLYLFTKGGHAAIERYAANVKDKQHFATIIKSIARNYAGAAPLNVLHQFTGKLIRRDALDKIEQVKTSDGNPCVCHFFLMKRRLSTKGIELAKHLYSDPVKNLMEKKGTAHITSALPASGNLAIQWVGWDTIKNLRLPYLKEVLSEIAYNNYKNIEG